MRRTGLTSCSVTGFQASMGGNCYTRLFTSASGVRSNYCAAKSSLFPHIFSLRSATTRSTQGISLQITKRQVVFHSSPRSGKSSSTALMHKEQPALRTDRTFCNSSSSSSSNTFTTVPPSSSKPPLQTTTQQSNSRVKEFWSRWIAEKPFPDRWSLQWWWEMAIIFTVFGITGSSSLFFVRPLMGKVLGVEGNLYLLSSFFNSFLFSLSLSLSFLFFSLS